jgi:hypothetical protein
MSEKSQSLVISERKFRLSVKHERKAEAIDGEVAHQALRQALLETRYLSLGNDGALSCPPSQSVLIPGPEVLPPINLLPDNMQKNVVQGGTSFGETS